MKFQFVTRSHHEEVVSNLREQLATAEAERRKLLDRLMVISTGRPIHEMPAEEPKTKS